MHVTSRVDSARIRLIDSFRCIIHQLTHSKAIHASPYLISPMFLAGICAMYAARQVIFKLQHLLLIVSYWL